MSSIFFSETNSKVAYIGNPFLTILESRAIIENEKGRIDLYLDQISKVRVIKKRDLSLNALMLFFAFLVFFSFVTHEGNMKYEYGILIVLAIVVSYKIKRYSFMLLINKGNYNFVELKIEKENLCHANALISYLKSQKKAKENRQIYCGKLSNEMVLA